MTIFCGFFSELWVCSWRSPRCWTYHRPDRWKNNTANMAATDNITTSTLLQAWTALSGAFYTSLSLSLRQGCHHSYDKILQKWSLHRMVKFLWQPCTSKISTVYFNMRKSFCDLTVKTILNSHKDTSILLISDKTCKISSTNGLFHKYIYNANSFIWCPIFPQPGLPPGNDKIRGTLSTAESFNLKKFFF